jgi:hypothetical protein
MADVAESPVSAETVPDVSIEGDAGPAVEGPGSETLSWVPEAYRRNAAVTRFKSAEAFIDNSLSREQLLGRTVQPPAEEASTEDRVKFYQKLPGMPKDAQSYTIDPLSVPEGARTVFQSAHLLDVMFNNGVPPHAADAILRHIEQQEVATWDKTREADQQAEQAAMQALERLWGKGFVERNLLVGLEGLKREFGEVEWLGSLTTKDAEGKERLLENTPQFAQMAYNLARFQGHDRFVPGGAGMPETVERARQELTEARTARQAGTMSDADYNAVHTRLAPIVYSASDPNSDDDVRIGEDTITAVDFQMENEER